MTRSSRKWVPAALALVLLGFGPSPYQRPQAGRPRGLPRSLDDPLFGELRRASVIWGLRAGPKRAVVDQVCLVADLPGFLDAISTWDRDHYFPVLFDDAATTARFLRAFRPPAWSGCRVARTRFLRRPSGRRRSRP